MQPEWPAGCGVPAAGAVESDEGGADCASTGYCAIGTLYQDKSGAFDAMTAVTHLRKPNG